MSNQKEVIVLPDTSPEWSVETDNTFLDIVNSACTLTDAEKAGWEVSTNSSNRSRSIWISVKNRFANPPRQGWKLHISAYSHTAVAVLHKVLPVLLAEKVDFKLARSPLALIYLNEGRGQASQIGKFITIYPDTPDQAVRLAQALEIATQNLTGPRVPSDRPLHEKSLVHYRYGGIGETASIQTPLGLILPALLTPEGELVPDKRDTVYQKLDWVNDPFEQAGLVTELAAPQRILADNYLLFAVIYNSTRSTIYLGADIKNSRSCVIKQASINSEPSLNGDSSYQRLLYEAEIYRKLGSNPHFPVIYDLIEQESEAFLVMEDLGNTTLEIQVRQLVNQGCWLDTNQVISWGKELATILGILHSKGLVYRDLKSNNVLLDGENRIKLIDFELAFEIGSSRVAPGRGTFGYMSPQQAAAEPPNITDDIYSLGALLYFMATGAEPSQAPNYFDLLARPIQLLNPKTSPALVQLITRCLATNPAERYSSMSELAAALDNCRELQAPVSTFNFGQEYECIDQSQSNAKIYYQELAAGLGDTLCATARFTADDSQAYWISTHPLAYGQVERDINTGNSGIIIALAGLVEQMGLAHQREMLVKAAHWLQTSRRPQGTPLAGLYVGEAGCGTALLRAGQVLADESLIQAALQKGQFIRNLPYTSPDLFNGTAGRLRFHLWLWNETSHPTQITAALEAGEELLACAEEIRPGELGWRIPSGYEDLSNKIYAGYAHGTSGIADALLDLYEASLDNRFLVAAQKAGRWLTRLAIPVLEDKTGLDWPAREDELENKPSGGLWCYGSAGIGKFFLHAARLKCLPDSLEIAIRGARAAARLVRPAGPVQCHGLAGNIEYLLDVYQATNDKAYLSESLALAQLLQAFRTEHEGHLAYFSDHRGQVASDFTVGYSGLISCFLRLSDPAASPAWLSLDSMRGKVS